ncbi:sensor histidine kinase [Caldimonas manganoxidans]|uniref:sensor histidine kinase n=1 Tax=Caldimonas manganoxidans TaxID=196015 RepID=UPI000375F162|nr:HAMP domain-containing sensor histidine kinase [Caldimonas manganoxidans]
MKPPPSIVRRLARTVLALSLAWAVLASAAVWLALRHEVDELLDDTLVASAEVLAGLLTQTPQPPGLHRDTGPGRYAWQWVGLDGQLRARSTAAPSQPWLTTAQAGFATTPAAAAAWRLYGRALPDGSMLYVGKTRAERLEALTDVALSVSASALGVGAVFVLWMRRRVRRELRPLTEWSERIARHDPLKHPPLPEADRLELQPLRDAVASLGDGLRRRLGQERAVAAQVAHALRTPLAGLDAQLAAAQVASPAEHSAALRRAREASRRLRRVVAAVITLFRSGAEPTRRMVDVNAMLQDLPIDGLLVHAAPDLRLHADPDLLAAALSNLLDNASRHGASQLWLEHAEGPEPPRNGLRLRDDGPGLPEARRRAIQQALDEQAYEGQVGLGLMLADLVARAHGGRVTLEPVDRGFAVRLDLGPAAAARYP